MKKGFTLIELLAVIVVLGLLAILVAPSVINQLARNKDKTSEVTKQLIFSGADLYEENNHMPNNAGAINCITLQQIVDSGYLEDPIIDGMSGKKIDLNLFVEIRHIYDFDISQYNTSYALVDSCTPSQVVCHAATESNKTSGNIPVTGKFEPGDEYLCEVKDNTWYNFFVLSEENDKVNLIMDSNVKIDGTPIKSNNDTSLETLTSWSTAWLARKDQGEACTTACSEFFDFPSLIIEVNDLNIKKQCPAYGECSTNSEYSECTDYQSVFAKCSNVCSTYQPSYGPVTAINFLNKATSSWVNIPKLNEKYSDQGGNAAYENFQLSGRARLPKITEIEPLFEEGYGYSVGNYATNMLPNWATNYLFKEDGDKVGRKTLLHMSTYWLMDFHYHSEENSKWAYAYDVGDDTDKYGSTNLFYDGKDGFGNGYGCDTAEVYPSPGVRPVISINKINISN